MIAVLPRTTGRPEATDLLLCGHHYRIARTGLTDAGAMVLDISGVPLSNGDWPDPA